MSKANQGGFEGIFGGLSDILDKLGDLAEKGQDLSKQGNFKWDAGGKEATGVYGFSVKFGLGDQEVKVEPFGNIGKDKETGQTVVHEVREPVVDVFEEEDHTLILVEMPGIGQEDIQLEVKDDILTIFAEKGKKKYKKEILLPKSYTREKMTVSCNNGIVEIKCIL